MFRKRIKKTYPPHTFIPLPARIACIIQLCLAFTVLVWNASEPFLGEIFTLKSRLLFYQDVMGIPQKPGLSEETLNRLERNKKRFHYLPIQQQEKLNKEMLAIQEQFHRSFLSKLDQAFRIFSEQMPSYKLLWLTLSLIIPIFLLKKVEGAAQAVWLLPLLTTVYAIDNRFYGLPAHEQGDAVLFPSEDLLVSSYIPEKFSDKMIEQYDQLQKGWHRYLILEWANEMPSENAGLFQKQVEKGEFFFTLARIDQRSKLGAFNQTHIREPLVLLGTYFFWNLLFALLAWICSKNLFQAYRLKDSSPNI